MAFHNGAKAIERIRALQAANLEAQEFVGQLVPQARFTQLLTQGRPIEAAQFAVRAADVFGQEETLRRKTGMGFFKTAFKLIGGAVKSFLGVPAKAAVQAVARRPALAAAGVAGIGAAGLTAAALAAGGGAAVPGAPGFVVNPATGELVVPGGGNGILSTTTMVTTVNRLTGAVVKQRIFVGSPFIMNKEVAHLKSTIKKLRRGAGKIPTRTRDPSLNSEINSAIKHSILHQAQRGAALALHGNPKDS